MTTQNIAAATSEAALPNMSGIRTIHPVRRREDWPKAGPAHRGLKRYAVLDTETSGLDPTRHCVVEICVAKIVVDGDGRIVALESIRTGLQDPGQPLSRAVREVTGLSDADLAGQSISRAALAEFLQDTEGCIAFNSTFDRAMVEHLLPDVRGVAWGCAMVDVDWRGLGFQPGAQNYLLMQAGFHNPAAHRARDDVLSLIQLLAHPCGDGETVLGKVIASMAAPSWRFEATGAPYHLRDRLADQRYRWSAKNKVWHKLVRQADVREEYRWYRANFTQRPSIVPVTATDRFRADYTWQPVPVKLQKMEDWEPKGDPF